MTPKDKSEYMLLILVEVKDMFARIDRPLDVLEVQGLRILLWLAPVGRGEGVPWDEDGLIVRVARLIIWWQLEITFE